MSYCYGMSKMCITDETNVKGLDRWDKLMFPEFLEFLARIAVMKFKDNPDEMSFVDKVKNMLDSCLSVVCADRLETEINEEAISESEDDY